MKVLENLKDIFLLIHIIFDRLYKHNTAIEIQLQGKIYFHVTREIIYMDNHTSNNMNSAEYLAEIILVHS